MKVAFLYFYIGEIHLQLDVKINEETNLDIEVTRSDGHIFIVFFEEGTDSRLSDLSFELTLDEAEFVVKAFQENIDILRKQIEEE